MYALDPALLKPFMRQPPSSFNIKPVNMAFELDSIEVFPGWLDILTRPHHSSPIDFAPILEGKKRPIWILGEEHSMAREYATHNEKSAYDDLVDYDPVFLLETTGGVVSEKFNLKSIQDVEWKPIDSDILLLLSQLADGWMDASNGMDCKTAHEQIAIFLRLHQDIIFGIPEIDHEDLVYFLEPRLFMPEQHQQYVEAANRISRYESSQVDDEVLDWIYRPKRRLATTAERCMAAWRIFISLLHHYLSRTGQQYALLSKLTSRFSRHAPLDIRSLKEEENAQKLLKGVVQQMIQQLVYDHLLTPLQISTGEFVLVDKIVPKFIVSATALRLKSIIVELRSYYFARKTLQYHRQEPDLTRPFVMICGKLHLLAVARVLERLPDVEVRSFTVDLKGDEPALEDVARYMITKRSS